MGTPPSPKGENQSDSVPALAKVSFAGFALDLRSGELTSDNKRIYLQQQPLEVLRMLLERSGEMVSREDLRERLWPGDTFVDFDHGLNKAVQKLRNALGDDSESPRFIETLPRRGYRFIASVSKAERATAEAQAQHGASLPKRGQGRLLALIAGGLALLAVLGFAANSYLRTRPAPAGAGQRRLAVLPFQNLSGDPEQEYFSDGITEEMIAHLSRFDPEWLAVIARTSAMTYKGSRKTVAEIGDELHVDYILEGSVRRDAGRVRITAQLVQVRDQSHLWAQSYEREISGIFPIQKEIADSVAREIGLRLGSAAPAAGHSRAVHPEAHDAFLRGLYLWHAGDGEAVAESARHFQTAVSLQPDYALAYAWLAFAYNRMASGDYVPPKEGYPLAKAAAHRAIELDPALPEGHAALGFILRSYEWDWQGAEKELRTALRADPNSSIAHNVYGLYLSTVGRHEEAIAAMKRAGELDPLSALVASSRAAAYANARRFDDAKAVFQDRGDAARSRSWPGILMANGEYKQALAIFDAVPADSQRPEVAAGRAQAYAALGRTREARALLDQFKAHPHARTVYSPFIARIHAQLGEKNEAFRWLQIAVEERAARVIYLKVDPAWDPLRGDSRFQDLLRRMNLAD
ncbi:MAG: winged helix-turn-helix domain-containing protein [Terriglobales bacterium]